MFRTDVVDDLEAEQDQLEAVLAGLPADAWLRPSAAQGWTVTDVVLHLAQTEEAVTAALGGPRAVDWLSYGTTVESAMAVMVDIERAAPDAVFARWRSARRSSVRALRSADPDRPVPWVTTALKPRTLATTRLAEHWAHALDITGPAGLAYPDTARLRHVAWLGWNTLPYAFRTAGLTPVPIHCDLTGPDGTPWQYGDPAAESTISGPAAAFCRVGARRLDPAASGLLTRGPHATEALRLLRNFAV
ncbi:maleylpyruvate isomerase family mycothiol-dependent enzyme [Symbioplanes lichenis]|uniref:maleylpyruvate isomerase family mycothiol-dependent enzyme n=1 Tax=Symbioplanes lichenis TaxID=1629072 RepID=UPI00273A131E|nr:maleylpyruvate isomerase family mycothiol-dependent enzyme [Actinoplanes lichenis]